MTSSTKRSHCLLSLNTMWHSPHKQYTSSRSSVQATCLNISDCVFLSMYTKAKAN